jgi:hypothetical protein
MPYICPMNFAKHLLWLVCLLVSICLLSCKEQGPKVVAKRELKYVLDTTKVGSEIGIGSVACKIPKGWGAADSLMIATLRKAASMDSSDFCTVPQAVYQDPASGAFLKASLFARSIPSVQNFTTWGRRYVDQFHAAHRDLNMSEDWLTIGGLPVVQIMYSDDRQVHLKLAIEGNPPVGLEYTVPRDSWQGLTKFIESSVGSIRKN